jgi:hypothetical protein
LLGLRGAYVPGFIVLTLLYQPLYANFNQGQVYVLLLGLLVLAWYGYRQRNAPCLGIALGLIFIFKTACAPLWLLLASQRQWHALVWATATGLLVGIGSLPWLGSEGWRTYFRLLAEFSSQPWLAVTAYQTQLSFWRHLFSFDAQWNPAPLFATPALAVWLTWLTLFLLLGVGIYRARTMKQDDLTFAGFVSLSIILSPVSLDYHYLLLLIPIAILLAQGREPSTPWGQNVLAVAVLLIAANLPYRSQHLAPGALALLAYPKLYGALALWGLAIKNE